MTITAIIGIIGSLLGICEIIWKPIRKAYNYCSKRNEEKRTAPFKELQSYLEEKLNDKIDIISEITKENRLAVLRVELNQLIHDDPENVDTICKLFEEYKNVGGNKYMDLKFDKWKAEQGF